MEITIIGANSFIARNLIVYLKRNYENRELPDNNFIMYLYDIHDQHIDAVVGYEKINFFSAEEVKNINFNVDYIYIFAGKTGTKAGFLQHELYVNVNEIILLNILGEYSKREQKRAKLIFPSSRLVYKGTGFNSDGTLMGEHVAVKLLEESEKEAKTVYAANKIACEYYLKMYNNFYSINYAIVRICVPYGSLVEGNPSYGTIGFMKKQLSEKGEISLYGTGDVKRTFTHMEDICECLYKAAITACVLNDAYNIGGEELSLKEVAYKVIGNNPGKVAFKPWPEEDLKIESGDTVFDSNKLDRAIGKKEYISIS